MGIRKEELNRLEIGTPCAASWEGMEGDRARRFCAECRRDVYDFERMTPREIVARVEASRGQLCARITRRDGRLSVLEEAERALPIEPVAAWADRRVSSIAATLVTAWLGAGAIHAQGSCAPIPSSWPPAHAAHSLEGGSAKEKSTSGSAAALRGVATDADGHALPGVTITATRHPGGRSFIAVTGTSGEFRLDGLEPGSYEVAAELEGFDSAKSHEIALVPQAERQVELALKASAAETITVLQGETAIVPKTIPELLAVSDLAIKAVTGASTVIEKQGEFGHMATELRIEKTYKGRSAKESILYLHWERLAAGGLKMDGSVRLAAGTRVLAFLNPSDERTGRPGIPEYRSADFFYGVRWLGSAELDACLEEVEALTR